MDCTDISSRLGECQICHKEDAKYKCPRCHLCTCSLGCVTIHKTQHYCNGIRNRVQMVSKREMDNFTILSDYRFLEEIDHKLEDVSRQSHQRALWKGKEKFLELPYHLQYLKNAAKKRGTIIELMPKHFSLHRENSTRFMKFENKIRWHVKLVFEQADMTFVEEKVDEECLLVNLLRKYLEPISNSSEKSAVKISAEDSEKLCYYQSAAYHRIVILFQSSQYRTRNKYIQMCLSKSLRANLRNCKVVEYPTFYIVLKDHLDAYLGDCNYDDELEAILNNQHTEPQSSLKVQPNRRLVQRVNKKNGVLNFFSAISDSSDENE